MFIESFGKFSFSQIRPFLFYSTLLLPVLLSGIYLLNQHASEEQWAARFSNAAQKGKAAIERKTRKEQFMKRHAHADPFFLDRQIESFLFLQKERSIIQSMVHHPALSNKRTLQERLDFLESNENRLAFAEENIRTSSKIKETDEKQRHPVQMDVNDLQKLLALIEDIPVGHHEPALQTPQILIRDMRIKKTETPLHSESYEVEMELLKREWIDP